MRMDGFASAPATTFGAAALVSATAKCAAVMSFSGASDSPSCGQATDEAGLAPSPSWCGSAALNGHSWSCCLPRPCFLPIGEGHLGGEPIGEELNTSAKAGDASPGVGTWEPPFALLSRTLSTCLRVSANLAASASWDFGNGLVGAFGAVGCGGTSSAGVTKAPPE
eukprot:CAMPEP_0183518546 /NCGR_PEP_ID=MMETSP0371-20130417/15549_1 /TAXON_ID=268820 /ORGANISM="Peridinium aciculiferum, Strain PAER-2" /LENGTH=165 /DNA_ID=CAMNT_0025716591 /DNA_START=149 /DNA_END=644 /DNA_ORIENTATION=+